MKAQNVNTIYIKHGSFPKKQDNTGLEFYKKNFEYFKASVQRSEHSSK